MVTRQESRSLESLDRIATCLEALLRRPALGVALLQRAKFEGWLKVELAHALEEHGAELELEVGVIRPDGRICRVDIAAQFPGCTRHLLMLKTVNTNFRFPNVRPCTRPITKNMAGVAEDLVSLHMIDGEFTRLAIFPVFPVSSKEAIRERAVHFYIDRILSVSGGRFVRSGFVEPSVSDGTWGISWFVLQV
jgi:hypothetical protein